MKFFKRYVFNDIKIKKNTDIQCVRKGFCSSTLVMCGDSIIIMDIYRKVMLE